MFNCGLKGAFRAPGYAYGRCRVSTQNTPSAPGARTPLPTIFAFGSVGMPLAGLLLVTGVYLLRYYAGLGVPLVVVGGAIGIVRLLDLGFDPAVALLMDRTNTPIGRYRPWLILGLPLVMLGVYMLLNPHGRQGAGYLIVWLLVAYAGNSMLALGVASWAAVLATNYDGRSRLFGWTQGIAVTGSVGLLLLPVITHGKIVLGKAASMPTIALILMVAFPVAVAICTLLTPERIAQPTVKPRFSVADYRSALGRPSILRIILADLALTLGPGTTGPIYIFFFHDAKGFTVAEAGYLLIFYIGAGIVGAPFWGKIAQRFGKHRTIQIACVCYAVTQTTLMVLPRVWPHHTLLQGVPTAIGMFSVGFCASAFLLLVRAMVGDIVDEVRLERGKDLTSLLYSMVTTTQKFGLAITATISSAVLQMVGYNGRENAVNTPHAIFGLEMCYLFAPIILVWVGGAMFFGYRLDSSRHNEIRAALDQRDIIIGEQSVTEDLTGSQSLTSSIAEAS
jgi:glycoside/pentoside/hexuronide:cation symporter, GPH family